MTLLTMTKRQRRITLPPSIAPQREEPTKEHLAKGDAWDMARPTRTNPQVRPARKRSWFDRYREDIPQGKSEPALTEIQGNAGQRYCELFAAAKFDYVPHMRWMIKIDGEDKGLSAPVLDARKQIHKANGILSRHELNVVQFVCCGNGSAYNWAIQTGRRPETGMEYLRDALNALDEHRHGPRRK